MREKNLTVIGTRPEIIKMSQMISMLDKNFKHQFIFHVTALFQEYGKHIFRRTVYERARHISWS